MISVVSVPIYNPMNSVQEYRFLHVLTSIYVLFDNRLYNLVKKINVILICIFLMAEKVKCFHYMFLVTCAFFS